MKLSYRALVLTVAKFANLGLSMLVGIALSRLLPRSDYGDYRQIWLIFHTVGPLLVMGLDDSVVFYVSRLDRSRHRGLLLQTITMLGLLGVLFSALFYFGGVPIAEAYGESIVPYLRPFALYPAFCLPSLVASLWLISIGRALTSAILTTLFEGVRALGTVALVVLRCDLSTVFLWSSGVAAANFLVMLWLIHRIYPGQPWRWDWGLVRAQWRYALPLGLAATAASLIRRLSQNVVAMAFTAETFAVFANGAFELPFINPLTSAVMVVLVPEFVRMGEAGRLEKIRTLWLESLRRLAIVIYPTTVFFFQFATPFMVLLFSDKYAESAVVFQVFTLILPMRIAQYSALLRAFNRTSWVLWTTLVSVGVTLALSAILLPWLGVYGPAWATVVGTYLVAVLSLLLIARLLGVSIWQVYPWKHLLNLAGLSLLAAVPTQLLVLPRAWPAWASLAIGGILYGVVYLGLGFVTKTIRRSDIDFVFDLVRRLKPKPVDENGETLVDWAETHDQGML